MEAKNEEMLSSPARNTRSKVRKISGAINMEGNVANKRNALISKWCEHTPVLSDVYQRDIIKEMSNLKQTGISEEQWAEDDSDQEASAVWSDNKDKRKRRSEVSFHPKCLDFDEINSLNAKQTRDRTIKKQAQHQMSPESSDIASEHEDSVESTSMDKTEQNSQERGQTEQSATNSSEAVNPDLNDPMQAEAESGSQSMNYKQKTADNEQSSEPETSRARTEEEEELIVSYKQRLQQQDNTVVFELFELLLEKMTNVQIKIGEVKDQCEKVSGKVRHLESAYRSLKRKSNSVRKELDETVEGNLKLVQSVVRCEQDVEDITNKTEKCESLMYRGCITISGIVENDNENLLSLVSEFLNDKLEIEETLDIVTMYRLGSSVNRPIFVRFLDPNDANYVLSQRGKLKEKKNQKKKPFYVNEYTTERRMDEQRRYREVIAENRAMPVSHQMTMEMSRGKLHVNVDIYEKEIQPPKAKDILLMSKDREQSLEKLETKQGQSKAHEGSAFYSYAVRANRHEEVKDAHEKIKLEHASATHIMCGYRLFGIRHHILQDYSDDKEIGGGRQILNDMKEAKVFNLAIFIVRYKTGCNIGKIHFQIISELTKSAITLFPEAVQYREDFQYDDKTLLQSLQHATGPR